LENKAIELIDKLVDGWSDWDSRRDYYLEVLAPAIVNSSSVAKLNEDEQKIVDELRDLLSTNEWYRLPALIRDRRDRESIRASHKARLEEQGWGKGYGAQRREDERYEMESRLARYKAAEENRRLDELRQVTKQHELERHKTEDRDKLAARKSKFLARLTPVLEKNFLDADAVFSTDPDSDLYNDLKTDFVVDWVKRELGETLDREQAAAVADVGGNIQVFARAGSGKTRTLVTRSIFLQRHCGVLPSELLLLAFNKKASEEMKNRLAEALGDRLPHVMTFHALAHALVHPEEELVFDDAGADQMGLSREVQDIIDEHVSSKEHGNCIRDLMLAHFRDDWERIVDGRFHLTMDEFLAHRRALPRESLKGEYVKSFGERLIANALFEHGVKYQYERNFRWDDFNYRPDFTIPFGLKGGVVIEYFGLQGDSDYDWMSTMKRTFWAERKEWRFLEYTPTDITQHGADAFVAALVQALRDAGVPCERLAEEEIWELVKKRALDGFTGAVRSFVGRCRKRNLSPDDVTALVTSHIPCSTSERLFLEVGTSVYRCYLKRLDDLKKEDFDGLMWRSVKAVRSGQSRFVRDRGRERGDLTTLRYVMIDEFQDFSAMFYELVDAIRSKNPRARYFCVGDNWQAINAFAGSDLRFFEDFEKYFSDISQHNIRTNYRSPKEVVESGNALMMGHGEPARAHRSDTGWVRLCQLDDFKPTASEWSRHNGDEITPALLRLLRVLLNRGLDVVMLSRRNGVPWYVHYDDGAARSSDALAQFLEHIRSYLPIEDRGRVSISTAHKYKGLERAAVIILDATDRSYPLIHPHWVFLRLFGDSIAHIVDEERRLFYVAITRATDSLAILTDTPAQSPFLTEIYKHAPMSPLSWETLPPVPSLDSPRLEVRVFNAYEVRDQLKDLGYRWDARAKCWLRAHMAEGFSLDGLLGQAWASRGVRIEVYSETGKLLHQR